MTQAFGDVTRLLEPFLVAFDLQKFKTATGHLPQYHATIDLQSAQTLALAQHSVLELSAEAEADAIFSKAVTEALNWFWRL